MKPVRVAGNLHPNTLTIKLSDQLNHHDVMIHAEDDDTAFFERIMIAQAILLPDERTGCPDGKVRKAERLGGLLNLYQRAACTLDFPEDSPIRHMVRKQGRMGLPPARRDLRREPCPTGIRYTLPPICIGLAF